MTIRPAEEPDGEILLALMQRIEAVREESHFLPGETLATIEEQAEQINWIYEAPNRCLLLAFSEEEAVGYAMALGGEFHINMATAIVIVELLPEYRRKGFGTALMEELEFWARQVPLHRLELTVIASNHPAIAFYEKLGFEHEGVKRQSCILGNAYTDEWIMAKLLV